MAVKLFLDNQEVITDSSQEIRITKENPYFTLSDSYTLDVTIPLSILQNRKFFGSIQRIDKKREYREFACKLYNSNSLLMEGTARIVQSTDLSVKVQLACGVSALKMSSEQEGTYIDSLVTEKEGATLNLTQYLDYGYTTGENHVGYGFPVLDNTNDIMVNIADNILLISRSCTYVSECPRLVDIAKLVAARIGYTIDMSILPAACQSIYVVSATHGNIGKKIPHWTVKEFFKQFQNFFGCTLIRSGNKALRLVPLDHFAQNPVTTITPLSEFQAEYSEEDDAEGIMNRNVEFEMENSGSETVDEEILEQAQYTQEYNSADAMRNAFRSDSQEVRMHKIYKSNGETYIGWEVSEGTFDLKRVAPFNCLKRFDGAESVKLKISPAYIEEDVECTVYDTHDLFVSPYAHKFNINVPSVSNPFGQSINWGSGESSQESKPTLQSLVEGSETIVKEEEKADIMSVAFLDGRLESVTAHADWGDGKQHTYQIHLAFTDFSFKKQLSNNRSKWSLSLNELTGYDFYLGQLHRLSFRCSHKVKHIFKFLSDFIPDADNVYIIGGKRYACEKIEASIREGNLDKLMTGYFYEIIS
jgi:hypothetical protein